MALVYYYFDPKGQSEDSHRATLIATTLVVVMFSITVFGAVTKPLLDFTLGMGQGGRGSPPPAASTPHELNLLKNDIQRAHLHICSISGACSGCFAMSLRQWCTLRAAIAFLNNMARTMQGGSRWTSGTRPTWRSSSRTTSTPVWTASARWTSSSPPMTGASVTTLPSAQCPRL